MPNAIQKLFYEDIHMVDFTAAVVECTPTDTKDRYQILLDRTAFFPEEGGQAADTGTLCILDAQSTDSASISPTVSENALSAPIPVLDVQIRGNLIYHITGTAIPAGTPITGHVNWDRRFDFMQQHSGEHILSGLIHSQFGLDNVGFHLGLEEVTLDTNGELTLEQLQMLELEANKVIWRNLPVLISYPAPTELAALEYRSKLDLTEAVRIVEIPGVDRCACCAPHVQNTGEIGILKITNVMRHRGGMRINILCGSRALADYTAKQSSVSAISVLLSAKQNVVTDAVSHLKEEGLRMREQYHALQTKYLSLAVQALPSPSDSSNAILFLEEANDIAIRNTINELVKSYEGYCGVFVGSDENGYRFIIGSSKRDCRELAGALRTQLQAKGGGTPPMIQGSVQSTQISIMQFFLQM